MTPLLEHHGSAVLCQLPKAGKKSAKLLAENVCVYVDCLFCNVTPLCFVQHKACFDK